VRLPIRTTSSSQALATLVGEVTRSEAAFGEQVLDRRFSFSHQQRQLAYRGRSFNVSKIALENCSKLPTLILQNVDHLAIHPRLLHLRAHLDHTGDNQIQHQIVVTQAFLPTNWFCGHPAATVIADQRRNLVR